MEEGILKKIRTISGHHEWAWDIEKQKGCKSYTLTRGNVAWALACSFLDDDVKWGHLNWSRLKHSQSVLCQERLKCIYDYFERVDRYCNMNEYVSYEWVSKPREEEHTAMDVLDEPFAGGLEVNLHAERMEDKEGTLVDFANANLHIHSIIGSVTQEELLFSVCSECFLALALFPKTLGDEDVVVFRNVWNHAAYKGYDTTFRFAGPLILPVGGQRYKTIIAIDACESHQFTHVWRDLYKAYIGFSAGGRDISTGNWGCGAFGGDVHLKFLQQVMAAQWARRRTLHYSTFGSARQVEEFTRLLEELRTCTCQWVLDTINAYNPLGGVPFGLHLKSVLMEKYLTKE